MYIELHTASAFSFLDGASLPRTLVERAAALGYPAVALLDRDGVYGAPQFFRAAKAAGLKAFVGAEVTMRHERAGAGAETSWTLPVLVSSVEGYRNLCRVLTHGQLKAPKGQARWTLDDFAGRTNGLVALVGREALGAGRDGVASLVDRAIGIFGRDQVWIELQRHLCRDDAARGQRLIELGAAFRVPIMASNGVRFAAPDDRPLYDVFTSLRHKRTLANAGRLLSANAERYLKSPEAMTRLFADVPDALIGTERLAERLEFTLADLGYRFPDYPVPTGETQSSFLRQLTQAGADDRYRPVRRPRTGADCARARPD